MESSNARSACLSYHPPFEQMPPLARSEMNLGRLLQTLSVRGAVSPTAHVRGSSGEIPVPSVLWPASGCPDWRDVGTRRWLPADVEGRAAADAIDLHENRPGVLPFVFTVTEPSFTAVTVAFGRRSCWVAVEGALAASTTCLRASGRRRMARSTTEKLSASRRSGASASGGLGRAEYTPFGARSSFTRTARRPPTEPPSSGVIRARRLCRGRRPARRRRSR